jgi:hypothetical protein
MSFTLDEYRVNWAIRYIREAEADLSMAEKTPIPAVSISFALLAMRKSQTAVYYSLGDPGYLAPLVEKNMTNGGGKDATMRILVQMEQLIHRSNRAAETLNKNFVIEDAKWFVEIASEMVKILVEGAS